MLSLFTVVRFPNDFCTGANGYNGTCYKAAQCWAIGGNPSGYCASGFGVCCIGNIAFWNNSNLTNVHRISYFVQWLFLHVARKLVWIQPTGRIQVTAMHIIMKISALCKSKYLLMFVSWGSIIAISLVYKLNIKFVVLFIYLGWTLTISILLSRILQ